MPSVSKKSVGSRNLEERVNKMLLQQIEKDLNLALTELLDYYPLFSNQILVVGCSTSEASGKRIGTATSIEVAEVMYKVFADFRRRYGFHLAFQACEHINRSLVVERLTADRFSLQEVTVIPVAEAGGAMATYAYQIFNEPVVVEQIKADCGIDVGGTLIGMHLKQVAVPYKATTTKIGDARLIMATTRPKLIGGERAKYNI